MDMRVDIMFVLFFFDVILFILVRIRVFLLVFNLFINWLFNRNYFEIFMKYIVFLVIFYRV